jgi:hypothetical protein
VIKKLLLLLTLPLLAITFNSCSSDDKDDAPNYEQLIVGTWNATHLNGEAWPYEATTYTYNADKTYSSSGYFNHAGTYTISGKVITFTYVDGEPYTYTIEILSMSTNNTKATVRTDWGHGPLTMVLQKQ